MRNLLLGEGLNVDSSMRICVFWSVVSRNLVELYQHVLSIIRTGESLIVTAETQFSEMSHHVVPHPRRQLFLFSELDLHSPS